MHSSLQDIETPGLILDQHKLDRNIARMAKHAATMGVPLRPHGKTPKCDRIAQRLMAHGAVGLTVSTLREAEHYFDAGIDDLFYAVGLAPQKAPRAAALLSRGADLKCLVDNLYAANAIAANASQANAVIPLMVEIDVDGYRAGIPVKSPPFMDLVRAIDTSRNLEFAGIMSYAGASYDCRTSDAAADLAERHRRALLWARSLIVESGIRCPIISFGSTPATLHARTMEGVTELRCGIYMFQDLFQAAIGACSIEDCALSVLTTVIGVRPDIRRVIVDAGGLALSKDLSTARTDHNAGYGLVCTADGGTIIEDVYVCATSQELGLLTTFSGATEPLKDFKVGDRLRILPNHADMTASAYDSYNVIAGTNEIIDEWRRNNGW